MNFFSGRHAMSFRFSPSPVTAFVAAALMAVGCREPLQPGLNGPAFTTAATALEVTGSGAIGHEAPVPGLNRQEFDFAITTPPAGRFFIRDYSTLRTSPGLLGTMTVDPADPATGISAVEQISATCVTVGGIGRVDTGDLFAFSATVCDHGSPGAWTDHFSFSVPEIQYEKSAWLNSGDITISGATKGDIEVTAATTGMDLDADGYTVTLDGGASQAIATNGTADFKALDAGTYVAQISGLAENCAVSDSDTRTVTVSAGSVSSVTFAVTCSATSTVTRVVGLGVIGTGAPLPRMERFELNFDVTSDLQGRLLLTDYVVVRSDGTPGQLTVDPADPETFISSFGFTSASCVAFGGMGRINDGSGTYRFFVETCDNANPGAGADTFSIDVPDRPYSKSGTLNEGDIAVSSSAP
jgi:hypothetical protein